MEFKYRLDGYTVILKGDVFLGNDKKSIMIKYQVFADKTQLNQTLGPFEIKASKDEEDRRFMIAAKIFSAMKKADEVYDAYKSKAKEIKPKKKVMFDAEDEIQEYMPTVKNLFFPSLFEEPGYISGEPYKVLRKK